MDDSERSKRGKRCAAGSWAMPAVDRRQPQCLQRRVDRHHHPEPLGRHLDAAAFRRAHAPRAGDRHLLALGRWDEFQLHVRAALTVGGFSPDDIKEIILQQATYCGVPAGNHAHSAGEAEVV